jgi:cell shape-determining protein MreC
MKINPCEECDPVPTKNNKITCDDCLFNKLKIENRKLKKALKFYADIEKYEYTFARSTTACPKCGDETQDRYEPDILIDSGMVAREALKE